MGMISERWLLKIATILFFVTLLFLSFNRHSKSGYFNYHSEIWADKAGYYVYLPAAFKYSFNPDNFPMQIDQRTGKGFKFDFEKKRIVTKYTYGVAFFQAPFYFLADGIARISGFQSDGFSPPYHWAINLSAVFYLLLGMFILFKFLRERVSMSSALITIALIFLGTNLYYYGIDETGMSHVYSFMLFSAFLHLLRKTNFLSSYTNFQLFGFFIIASFIVLIRASNVLFLLLFFFLDTMNLNEIWVRIRRVVRPKLFALGTVCITLVFLPQLIYWRHTHGSFLYYSYENEGFDWSNPAVLQVLFAPKNGLFLYTPIVFIILFSMLYYVAKRNRNALFILLMFCTLTYVLSCWWDRSFGCSFGARSYVEYLSIFSLPLAFLLDDIKKLSNLKRIMFGFLVILLVGFNLKLTYTYDGCFHSLNAWDWSEYISLVISPTK